MIFVTSVLLLTWSQISEENLLIYHNHVAMEWCYRVYIQQVKIRIYLLYSNLLLNWLETQVYNLGKTCSHFCGGFFCLWNTKLIAGGYISCLQRFPWKSFFRFLQCTDSLIYLIYSVYIYIAIVLFMCFHDNPWLYIMVIDYAVVIQQICCVFSAHLTWDRYYCLKSNVTFPCQPFGKLKIWACWLLDGQTMSEKRSSIFLLQFHYKYWLKMCRTVVQIFWKSIGACKVTMLIRSKKSWIRGICISGVN